LIVERIVYAAEIETNNVPLTNWLRAAFVGSGADFDPVTHARMLSDVAASARVIVRAGAFNPWGNIGLVCGTDPDAWFAIPGTVMPEAYVQRKARMPR
jgi:D-ribose pyranase